MIGTDLEFHFSERTKTPMKTLSNTLKITQFSKDFLPKVSLQKKTVLHIRQNVEKLKLKDFKTKERDRYRCQCWWGRKPTSSSTNEFLALAGVLALLSLVKQFYSWEDIVMTSRSATSPRLE